MKVQSSLKSQAVACRMDIVLENFPGRVLSRLSG